MNKIEVMGRITKKRVPRKGSLREVGVAPKTLRRYRARIHWFFVYLFLRGFRVPESLLELDERASGYLDHLWREGEPEGWATDFVSGLRRLVPRARRELPCTGFFLANWRRTVVRKRALPLTPFLLRGLVGLAVALGKPALATVMLLGFVGLLRTDEILKLRYKNVLLFEGARRAVVVIPDYKSGKRFNTVEKVVVSDPVVLNAFVQTAPGKHPEQRIYEGNANTFNDDLRELAVAAGVPSRKISGYSLRRGGATWHFLTFGSLSKTTVHGRWSQERLARVYIDGALAQQGELELSARASRILARGCRVARLSWTDLA